MVRNFDARFQGKRRLDNELGEIKMLIEEGETDAAIKKLDTLRSYLDYRDVLVGYSYNEEEAENESVSDGENMGEAMITSREHYRQERAENQYT